MFDKIRDVAHKIKIVDPLKFFVEDVLQARWIVSLPDNEGRGEGELGLRIAGIQLWYYKYSDPTVANRDYRVADKREFGEVVLSRRHPPSRCTGDTN